MFSSLIVLALSLAGQINGTDNRYSNGVTGPPPTTNTAPGGAPATITPFSTPATNNAAPNSTNAASAPSTSPYKSTQPSAFNQQPARPLNSNRAPANTGAVQPPPGYQGQNSFPSSDATSTQQPPSKSAQMMKAMLSPPVGNQLSGERVLLVDVVSTGRTRNEQTQRIEAYWDLCSSVADYYLSVREQEELRALTSAASRQSAALQESEKKMSVRTATSLSAARASQYRLAGFIGRSSSNLPLPADVPHCGTYNSRYDQVFAGRSSPEAQTLAQLLPMRYAELDDVAVGVFSAEDWLKGVIARNENSDAVGNLRALELLALQRRAFVQIARDYNRRIARYSELATPGQVNPDRLTGMLIKRTVSVNSPPPVRNSGGVEGSPPRTFVNTANTEDWLPAEKPALTGGEKMDSAVTPASATQSGDGQERSVMVKQQ